jgi:hypothetical protein
MEQTRYSWAAYEYHRASKRRERERQARLRALQESLAASWAAQQVNDLWQASRPQSPTALLGRSTAALCTAIIGVQVRVLGLVVRLCLR